MCDVVHRYSSISFFAIVPECMTLLCEVLRDLLPGHDSHLEITYESSGISATRAAHPMESPLTDTTFSLSVEVAYCLAS